MKPNNYGIKLNRRSRLQIVSSGYSDRFVMSDCHMLMRVDGITFRIDGDDSDRIAAFAKLAGLKLSEIPQENFLSIVRMVNSVPIDAWLTYRTPNGSSRAIKTTYSRITAGIHAALGYENLTDYGIAQHKPIAETLTPDEWAAIRYWLQTINDKHLASNRPVVNFTIPEVAHD